MVVEAPVPTGARQRVVALQVARPPVLAGERVLPVGGGLGGLLPGGGLRRGSVAVLDGPCGAGVTSVALSVAAAVTTAGEWAAVLDDGTLGGVAAAEAGVALERLAVVRRVPASRWATVVAALLDGASLVVAAVPPHARVGDARRLVSRARERGAALLVTGRWPAEAAVRVQVEGVSWSGLGAGAGLLTVCTRRVRVEGRGAPVWGEVVARAAAG
jgi:hypothetical protein